MIIREENLDIVLTSLTVAGKAVFRLRGVLTASAVWYDDIQEAYQRAIRFWHHKYLSYQRHSEGQTAALIRRGEAARKLASIQNRSMIEVLNENLQ